RRAPASSAAAMGRICSSYSASAPSVNPSIHHPAWSSHNPLIASRSPPCSSAPARQTPSPPPVGRRRHPPALGPWVPPHGPPLPTSTGAYRRTTLRSSDAPGGLVDLVVDGLGDGV